MEKNFTDNLFSNAQYDDAIKQILLSLFCLFVFVVLFYFYRVSIKNVGVKKHNTTGLLFLSLSFFSFFLMGITQALFKIDNLSILLYGLINIFLLLSIPFFSKGTTLIDKVAKHFIWYAVAGELTLIYGIGIFFAQKFSIDLVVSCLTFITFGFFLSWDFIRKQLNFLGLLSALGILLFPVLQILAEINATGGKFSHLNITVFYPCLGLSMTVLIVTFNWMNEVRFKDLATFYTEGVDKEMIEKFFNKQITIKELKDDWKTELKNSNLETVIEEMIMIAEKRNESLEMLLTLASRNTRNNNSRYISNIIDDEDYKLERNKISEGIVYLLEALQL